MAASSVEVCGRADAGSGDAPIWHFFWCAMKFFLAFLALSPLKTVPQAPQTSQGRLVSHLHFPATRMQRTWL